MAEWTGLSKFKINFVLGLQLFIQLAEYSWKMLQGISKHVIQFYMYLKQIDGRRLWKSYEPHPVKEYCV